MRLFPDRNLAQLTRNNCSCGRTVEYDCSSVKDLRYATNNFSFAFCIDHCADCVNKAVEQHKIQQLKKAILE